MRIAIFDLDGTLSRRDTLFPYLLGFSLTHPRRLWRWLRMPGPVLRYCLRGRDRTALKQALIVALLRGVSREDIERWNAQFVPRLLRRAMHARALQQVQRHRTNGDYLIVMSASPDLYVPAIARALGINETMCTGVRWQGLRLDGALTTPNRRDLEKLNCLRAVRARWPGCIVMGYGNSEPDLIHLAACDRGHLVNGDARALRAAAGTTVTLGWPEA